MFFEKWTNYPYEVFLDALLSLKSIAYIKLILPSNLPALSKTSEKENERWFSNIIMLCKFAPKDLF